MARISSELEKMLILRARTGGMPRVPDLGMPSVFSAENEEHDIAVGLNALLPISRVSRVEPPSPPMSWRSRIKNAWRIIRTGRS